MKGSAPPLVKNGASTACVWELERDVFAIGAGADTAMTIVRDLPTNEIL